MFMRNMLIDECVLSEWYWGDVSNKIDNWSCY